MERPPQQALTAGEAAATIREIVRSVRHDQRKRLLRLLPHSLSEYWDNKDKEQQEEEDDEDEEDEEEQVEDEDEEENDDQEEEEEENKLVGKLDEIAAVLREQFPLEKGKTVDEQAADKTAEQVETHSDTAMFRGLRAQDTVAVDAFVYSDADIDAACNEGTFSRSYCADCGSRHVLPLGFISDSLSREQIAFVLGPRVLGRRSLRSWLAKERLCVVDVGSRVGGVLYGFALALPHARVVGVEKSAFFCGVQRRLLADKRFSRALAHVEVVQDDVRNQGALLAGADVVVLNNAFEFFVEAPAEERALWRFTMGAVRKPGCLVVTVPTLEEVMQRLNSSSQRHPRKRRHTEDKHEHKQEDKQEDKEEEELDFFADWVEPLRIDYPSSDEVPEEVCEMQGLINLYRVKA